MLSFRALSSKAQAGLEFPEISRVIMGDLPDLSGRLIRAQGALLNSFRESGDHCYLSPILESTHSDRTRWSGE
jgi:hypothetical protein